ncbi:GM25078 [Drosophila sechellia]|uniref:GM25078 n=1 Tax=Drosophila sechellia TaxID=7238 RepID=B4HK10_DROSE|nr:GM25078 [Drosophila sechellia]
MEVLTVDRGHRRHGYGFGPGWTGQTGCPLGTHAKSNRNSNSNRNRIAVASQCPSAMSLHKLDERVRTLSSRISPALMTLSPKKKKTAGDYEPVLDSLQMMS